MESLEVMGAWLFRDITQVISDKLVNNATYFRKEISFSIASKVYS